jgi:hypothetical protein
MKLLCDPGDPSGIGSFVGLHQIAKLAEDVAIRALAEQRAGELVVQIQFRERLRHRAIQQRIQVG